MPTADLTTARCAVQPSPARLTRLARLLATPVASPIRQGPPAWLETLRIENPSSLADRRAMLLAYQPRAAD